MATQISDLRPSLTGATVTVKVLEAKVVVERPKSNRSEGLKVAECLVGDKTGCIIFSARNDQVEKAQPGSYIMLQNAKVDMYRGSMRLVVDKSGKVEEAAGEKFSPKENMSPVFRIELNAAPAISKQS
ncbi:DNA-binding related protein [Dunaliella salina]|uniref:DNA-binding related protein n=1 Tax=Dunaliella salina TaxID=3046 RepID=A0ABQ7G1D4_DUNSA|nr:DNA-binding related protein [Dunaliella salina]|eukprot:KAF5828418.1 DNA-binding related protein [Dunaliella salina]